LDVPHGTSLKCQRINIPFTHTVLHVLAWQYSTADGDARLFYFTRHSSTLRDWEYRLVCITLARSIAHTLARLLDLNGDCDVGATLPYLVALLAVPVVQAEHQNVSEQASKREGDEGVLINVHQGGYASYQRHPSTYSPAGVPAGILTESTISNVGSAPPSPS
jgi:hypothetical protein